MKEITTRKQLLLLAGMILLTLFLFAGCSKSGETEVEIAPSTPVESNGIEEAEEEASEFSGVMTYLSCEFTDTRNGYAIVKNPSGLLYGLVDMNGNQVIDFKYDDLEFLDVDEENYLQAKYEGKYGVIDRDGKEVLPFDHTRTIVVNHSLMIREFNQEESWAYTDNHDNQGFSIFNSKGEKTGEYFQHLTHATNNEIRLMNYQSIDDDVFLVFGEAGQPNENNFAHHIDPEFCFLDIVKSNGSIIKSYSETFHFSCEVAWNPAEDCYSISQPAENEILMLTGTGEIISSFSSDKLILGWSPDGYALVHDGIFNLMDLSTGEMIRSYDNSPKFQKTDSLLLFDRDVFDNNGNLVFTSTENVNLLNDKILYKDHDAGTYKLIYADGTPVYDDRYFGCFSLENDGHRAYFLENGDGEVFLLSETGEKLADYGTFTMSGSSDHPSFYYNGMAIQDYRLTDESLSLWFYDSYLTFFYA